MREREYKNSDPATENLYEKFDQNSLQKKQRHLKKICTRNLVKRRKTKVCTPLLKKTV